MLDQAEIPTVQERGLGRAEVLRRKLEEVAARPAPDRGRPAAALASGRAALSFPTGAGGLTTTRLELTLCCC